MFFGITNIWTYVIGTVLIILLPGPNSIFVLATAAQRGVRVGYRAACGVFLGDGVLMLLSAAGAASLLQSNPVLFSVVKYSGAAYLAWIGLGLIRSAWRSWRSPAAAQIPGTAETPPADHAFKPFTKALTISLLNPKAILFFVAFFVQFVDPAYSAPGLSFLILAVIVEVFSFLYLTALIFGGSFLAAHFRRRRTVAAGLTSGVGALFLGFGAKLATASLG
jgi:leucine efflux protein